MACNYQGLSKVFLSAASVVAMFVLFGAVLSGAGAAVEAAGACNATNCVLPDCQCASMDIPGGLNRDQVPQMVTISFDDSLRLIDYNSFFNEILKDRKNPNGQNVSFTFFVSHEYTDYSLASKLAGMGHELAVHSVTHRTPNTFWSSGENDAAIEREIVDMKNLLVRWADVPEDRVVGWRTPFLASSEDQLKILHENDFLYDCTMVTNDMYWPFTLDYKSPICDSPAVCPDQALPGLWVVPNVNKVQNSSFSCSMIDGCAHPTKSTYDQWMYFFKHNFERHYNNNKVPFGLYAHASWFYFPNMADRLRAFIDFMGYLGTLDDVYIVSMSQLVAWSKNPTPLSEISSFQPWQFNPAQSAVCSETNGKTCSYNRIDGETQYFHICGSDTCPYSYPTIFNSNGSQTIDPTASSQLTTVTAAVATSELKATTAPLTSGAESQTKAATSSQPALSTSTSDSAPSSTPFPDLTCLPSNCVLPNCQCASKDIPGGLNRDQVPQMVTISFDDSLRLIDYNSFFSEILEDRKNPNGQNVSFTFFVSHEYTDYSLASKLARMGHELAVHSVTHRTPNTFWSSGENDAVIEREIVDMKNLLVRWADVPEDRVVGWRTPFLASSEDQLKFLHENDFLYDCTMVTNDMYWPFTLDHKSPICDSPAVCPDQALPGLWVIPNVNKVQNSSFSCSMIDGCAHPTKSTYDQWMYFFKHNFERHYNNNKVPFGLYAHASWFYFPNMADRLRAFIDFMGYLGTLDDVYIVSMSQLVAWSKNPTPLSEISSFQPWQFNPAQSAVCSETNGKTCSYNRIDGETQYFHICGSDTCPYSYPTIFNSNGSQAIDPTASSQLTTVTVAVATSDLIATTAPLTSGAESQTKAATSSQPALSTSTSDSAPSSTPFPDLTCLPSNCVLPNCQCASKDIPGGLNRDQVPQMVTISFDDSLRLIDYNSFFSEILEDRKNPNGQNVSFTFFVSHEYTDYSLASKLARMGHELAVHSVTHRTPNTFWSSGENDAVIEREIVDMKNLLVRWADVPEDRVVGWRTPFLASSEDQLKFLHENDFLYDCTMVTNDMYWPFTLDHKSPICDSPAVCPDQALPGLWVIPNVNKVQNSSFSCSMIDGCAHPTKSTYDQWMYFFKHNFERHYNNNKVPFGLYAHASWFYFPNMADRLRAFIDFMGYLGTLDDVYIVSMSQLVAWSKNPTPLSEISSFQPWQFNPAQSAVCSETNGKTCSYNRIDGETQYFHICGDDVCPESYPTLYNPEGKINVESSSTYEIQSMSVTSSSLDITGATSYNNYELFQTTVSSSPQDQSSGHFANAHITSTVPISSNVISSMSASQSALPSILNTMTTQGIRLPASSDSTMPIASASELARIIVSSMASNSAGQPEMMTTMSQVEFLTESSSAVGTSTTGENSMQTVLLLSEIRTLLAETVAITTSSSITVSDSVSDSTVDSLEDSTSGAVAASEQTSDAALSMAITTSSSNTVSDSVSDSTVDSLEDSTSGAVVASEQTSDAALSMAITTSSSITVSDSVSDSTVDSLEDSTSGAVVASEQTSDAALSMAITTSSSITVSDSVSDSTVDSLEDFTSGAVVASEQTSGALSMAITTSSSIAVSDSVSDSTVDSLEDSTSGAVVASEQTSDAALSMAITTSSSITVSDSVSDSTVDSLEDSTSGAVVASEQTSDAALSMAITTSSSITVSDSVSDSTVDSLEDSTSGAVVASEQTSGALSMAITTSSSITVNDSVSESTVDSLEDFTSGAVVASEQTSGALSMAITTSSSIAVSDSVSDSTVDSLDNTTSGAAVTSEQTSGALSMAITTSSSNTVSDSVLESTVDSLEDFTSGAVVASEQTSGALSMAITTSSSITVSDSVSDSTVDSLEDTTSGAVVASEQTSDVPASSSVIMRTHYPSSSSMGTFTADQGNMQTVTLPGESSALRAETMAIATASSITSVADSVSDSASDSLEETTSSAVEVSKQTSDVLSGADMGTQYLSSGTSESAHSSPPVSSSTSVSTTSPAGDELQDELNPGLTPGVAAAIAIAVVVTVVAAVAVTAGLGAVAVKSGGLASTASTATIMSNPLSSSVPV